MLRYTSIATSLVLLSLMTLLLSCRSSSDENPPSTDPRPAGTSHGTTAVAPPPGPVDPNGTPGVTVTPKGDTVAPWTVGPDGVPGAKIGQTRSEVEKGLGVRLEGSDTSSPCIHLRSREIPNGVSFMFSRGTLARIDVDMNNTPTAAGALVGDPATRIDSLYRGSVKVTPHKYLDGTYMTVTPRKSPTTIVFETEAGKVIRYRIGRRPEVEWVEGCS